VLLGTILLVLLFHFWRRRVSNTVAADEAGYALLEVKKNIDSATDNGQKLKLMNVFLTAADQYGVHTDRLALRTDEMLRGVRTLEDLCLMYRIQREELKKDLGLPNELEDVKRKYSKFIRKERKVINGREYIVNLVER